MFASLTPFVKDNLHKVNSVKSEQFYSFLVRMLRENNNCGKFSFIDGRDKNQDRT